MKKKLLSVICTVVAMLMMCTVFLTGCFGGGENNNTDTTPTEYTIQYTDDVGTHTITVTDGMPYSLDVVPTKTGYDFLGLYDAEVGGTQYISASGSSLAPYTDKKNMVLFPQYKAKDYTVILDYQGAPVTGSRQLIVSYGSSLPELPKNLTGDHKEFAGWYTEAECGGIQIADEYGLIPLVSVLNEQNFNLSGTSVTLYAGFEMEKHTVTFCFEAGMDTEEIQVPYNTSISEVVPETRVDGNAVLTWSKTQSGEVWNGKVTGDMVLYAVEYAPVIEFDSNGGDEVTPIVAREGSTIALPTPTKDLAKFSYWEDMSGNKYTATSMPNSSISLKAIWQAKLVFDENGGSDVDDISVAAGTTIELPTPEREGFIFAGWYKADKEEYTSITMPATGIALKAGWYKAKEETIIVTKDNKNSLDDCAHSSKKWSESFTDGPTASWRKTVDLSQFIAKSGGKIKLTLHIDMKNKNAASVFQGGIYLYDGAEVSSANYLTKFVHKITKNTWETFSNTENLNLRSDTLYLCYYASTQAGSETWDCLYYTNIWLNLEYPDTTILYL